jgi:hypothetical protein
MDLEPLITFTDKGKLRKNAEIDQSRQRLFKGYTEVDKESGTTLLDAVFEHSEYDVEGFHGSPRLLDDWYD